jgi:hypothetical protein
MYIQPLDGQNFEDRLKQEAKSSSLKLKFFGRF